MNLATAPFSAPRLLRQVRRFSDFQRGTRELVLAIAGRSVPVFVNEFWTSQQRAAHSLHEVSYRACFKPQLPRFFIERLTAPGDTVFDPFMGRGTTLLEAALLGRVPAGCDVNPLSELLAGPRMHPPSLSEIEARLGEIEWDRRLKIPEELLVFYHRRTLQKLVSLRRYLLRGRSDGTLDHVDRWIWMVAINRLTGHSPGFFSVYTLPPNQAVSARSQARINRLRGQRPEERDVAGLILRKSRRLLADVDVEDASTLRHSRRRAKVVCGSADEPNLRPRSVQLAVTSPPFLDVVDYAQDNWLRGWFAGVDSKKVKVSNYRRVDEWEAAMGRVFAELRRVLVPGGYVAFEVGEVRNGSVKLEEAVVRAGVSAGLDPLLILINDQAFTKTSNCWGIENLKKGTNTNRVVVFRKDC